ncbi:hypothetical protein ACMA1I_11410 [Pontibacter sp. 13R65]|uniref:hypothetical protein n=1 Tax=Pontibacter sp. 13R65 TaxID=3127458 RepID=UPI00301BE6FD
MKTITLQILPKSEDLLHLLQNEISGSFSCKVSEDNKNIHILIKKSRFLSTKILAHENVVTIEGTFTSKILSLFASVFSVTYLNLYPFLSQPWNKMEEEAYLTLGKIKN